MDEIMRSLGGIAGRFEETYARLSYAGYVAVLGAVLIFVPLVTRCIPIIQLEPNEQLIYVVAGTFFILLGATSLSVHNIMVFKLQKLKQDTACRMLEIRMKGIQIAHTTTVAAVSETRNESLPDDPFQRQ
jgi:cytochrome c biogenesis protein CcdA